MTSNYCSKYLFFFNIYCFTWWKATIKSMCHVGVCVMVTYLVSDTTMVWDRETTRKCGLLSQYRRLLTFSSFLYNRITNLQHWWPPPPRNPSPPPTHSPVPQYDRHTWHIHKHKLLSFRLFATFLLPSFRCHQMLRLCIRARSALDIHIIEMPASLIKLLTTKDFMTNVRPTLV